MADLMLPMQLMLNLLRMIVQANTRPHFHARFWNPYDFDLLEFIGKNVAGE